MRSRSIEVRSRCDQMAGIDEMTNVLNVLNVLNVVNVMLTDVMSR